MKLTFIGTSHGVPAADRHCSAMMLTVEDATYFIDAGAPVASALLAHVRTMQSLRAVFTTHAHGDHTIGVVQLSDLVNWYYTDCAADFFITEQAHIDAIKAMIITGGTPTIDETRVRYRIPTEGQVYEDEYIRVEYIRTAHMPISYAILVTEVGTGKRILFGGDFSGELRGHDIPKVIEEPIDGFVCEMAHFRMEHLRPYLATCRAARVYFTHVFPLDNYKDIEGIVGRYSFEVIMPRDGDAYEL